MSLLENNSCFITDKKDSLTKLSRLIPLHIGDVIPLKTEALMNWPNSITCLCLHCSEKIPGTPLPAVKYYDSHDNKFWVYGYFCRPCCSLAYVQDHPNTDTARCIIWTQAVLRNIFGFKDKITPAPPRCALQKYGGQLNINDFYGESEIKFKQIHNPPFVTFAMYAEMTNTNGPNNDKQVHGLRRPTERTYPVAKEESTQKPPLILEFLAQKGLVLKNSKTDVVTEPTKKSKKSQIPISSHHEDNGGFLSRFLVKE